MKVEGKHICKNCNNEFEWWHQVAQNIGSNVEAEIIPKNKAILYEVSKFEVVNDAKMPKEASVYCPNCDTLNYIIID